MPHLGTLFGLTEDATTAMILVEMGYLSEHQEGTTTVTCPQGWDGLVTEFKVNLLLEIDTLQFKGKSVWYVHLGNPPPEGFKYPSHIVVQMYKSNPQYVVPPTQLHSLFKQ